MVPRYPLAIIIRPSKLDYLFLIHKNLHFHAGRRSFFVIYYCIKYHKSDYPKVSQSFKKLILTLSECLLGCKMIPSLLSIEKHVNVIVKGNNEMG